MCDPIFTPLLIGVAAASAGLQYYGQAQQAKAQTQMAEQNAQIAQNSFRVQQQQLQAQLLSQRTQAEQDDVTQTIQAEQAKAQANNSAAAAGVSGVSLQSILSQADRQRAMNRAVSDRNYTTLQQDELTKEGQAYYDMQGRVNSVPTGVMPSLAAPVLQVAGAGLDVYGKYFYQPKVTTKAGS